MSLINYTYLTTNLITGEQYVGDHTINPLDKKYYQGSGKYLARAIKKYRSENFFKEILEWFPTKQEAFDAQEKYIIYFNTLTPNGYNISPKGGHQCKESVSSETKQKIGKSNKDKKRTLEQIKNISNGHLNLHHSEGTKQKISDNNVGMLGKHHTEKTKEKMKTSHKGKKYSLGIKRSEEAKENMRKPHRKFSEESKQNMRKPKSQKAKENISKGLAGKSWSQKRRDAQKGNIFKNTKNI